MTFGHLFSDQMLSPNCIRLRQALELPIKFIFDKVAGPSLAASYSIWIDPLTLSLIMHRAKINSS